MTFKNKFPKKEVTIVTDKKVGCLMSDSTATIHYRDYKGYLDSIQHITLDGARNAWHEIKNDFFYDTLMNQVKDVYTDSFNRALKVTILKQ